MRLQSNHSAAVLAGAMLALCSVPAAALAAAGGPSQASYAEVADLADSAGLVVRATVTRMVQVEQARAPGVRPGYGRFYVEARTRSLLAGASGVGESIRYLVDLPFDARGKAPKLKKQDVLVFARTVPGRPGEMQLVTPTAQRLWSEAEDARVRGILKALMAPDAPAKITGVRELLYVPGNLAGQGETQIFLTTKDNSAASITVRHEPGAPPVWGVSFSELVAELGHPPARDTLEWYRLACFLPNVPPPGVNVSEGYKAQRQAEADYRMVLGELGVCERNQS